MALGFRVLRKAGRKQQKWAGWNGERTRSIDAGCRKVRAVSRRRGPERRDPIPSPPPRVLRGREPLPLLRAAGGPARTCQYIGDAKGNARDWAVCGKRSVAGRSYCQEHVEICYQGGGGKDG